MTSELHMAAGLGDIARVTKLLEQGADVNAGGPAAGNVPAGCTALMLAAARDHEDMVKLLLSRGANPNQSDQGGGTALIYASWKGYKGIVSVLLAAGASPSATTHDGRSPLSVARQYGHNEIATMIERAAEARERPSPPTELEVNPASRAEPMTEAAVPREPQPARESNAQPKAGGEENATAVDAGQFQFKVPATWTRAPKSEEDELKHTMLAGARQMLDTEKGSMEIEQFYMFKTPEDAMVLVYNVLVPATMPVHDYMTKLRAMNETKFEYGRQSGIVKRVIKIKLTEAKDLSVLETEYVAAQGKNNRTLIYNLAGGPSPKFTVAISAFFPENDDQFQESVKKVMASVGFGKAP